MPSAKLDKGLRAGYSNSMGLPMKRLWLVGIFLILLVMGVLVQHAGRTGFTPAEKPEQQQNAAAEPEASGPPDSSLSALPDVPPALPQASASAEAGRAPEAVAVEDYAGVRLPQPVPGSSTDASGTVSGNSAPQPALTPDTPLVFPSPDQPATTASTEEQADGTA